MKDNDNEDKILDATMQVVSQYTISGTRMRLIAQQAGITQSNIHYYFKSKEDLLSKMQRRTSKHCFKFRDDIRGEYDPECLEDQIEIFIRQKLDFLITEAEYDFVEMDFWMQTRVNPVLKEAMNEGFIRWRQEIYDVVVNKFAPDMPEKDKRNLCYVVISLLEGASIQYHIESFDVEEYFKYCKQIIVHIISISKKGNEKK